MTSFGKVKSARLDAETLGLRALAYVIGDPALGPRLLALTGLDIPTLRTRAGDPALLGATLAFLEGHEPSLLACAEALEVTPQSLIAAREALSA
jgi:hypothetical protein